MGEKPHLANRYIASYIQFTLIFLLCIWLIALLSIQLIQLWAAAVGPKHAIEAWLFVSIDIAFIIFFFIGEDD